MKRIRFFYLKIFIFLMVKFSTYLNRRVFLLKHPKILYTKLADIMPHAKCAGPDQTAPVCQSPKYF